MPALATCASAANIIDPIPLVYVTAIVVALGAGAKLMMWIGSVNEHKKFIGTTLGGFMAEIRHDIKQILDRLPPLPVASGSPLRLTDRGNAIAAQEWTARVAPTLVTPAEGMLPYEIQELCSEYVRRDSVFDETQEVEIKE